MDFIFVQFSVTFFFYVLTLFLFNQMSILFNFLYFDVSTLLLFNLTFNFCLINHLLTNKNLLRYLN